MRPTSMVEWSVVVGMGASCPGSRTALLYAISLGERHPLPASGRTGERSGALPWVQRVPARSCLARRASVWADLPTTDPSHARTSGGALTPRPPLLQK